MDAEKGDCPTERRGLLRSDASASRGSDGEPATSWPVMQPNPKYDPLHCFPCACPFLPLATCIFYFLTVLGLVLFGALSLVAGILCCIPWGIFYSWTYLWCCCPYYWQTDLYQKMIYMSYWGQNQGTPEPVANQKFLPVSGIKPKAKLKKYYVDYAVNLQVPAGPEDQFLDEYLNPAFHENFIEHRLPMLPMTDRFDRETFRPNEDPVEFVMTQMSHIYPSIYQKWEDKQSDRALTRFALYGIGAHRVEAVMKDGKKMFVVRTNALAGLPVRPTFERYGGDAYFDENWQPVMIIDEGLSTLAEDCKKDPVITRPGDDGWNRAKFRFRSSLFTLVTLVDHLYGSHLQTANLFVTALREQLSADHPIRRFLTPFTYQTISINDNAKFNLTAPRSMGPRCFALTEKGMSLAFSAAPYLLQCGENVPSAEGGPLLNMADYVSYLKRKGVDTEYWRQVGDLLEIYETFIEDYLACYYARKDDVARDPELVAMAAQYFDALNSASPDSVKEAMPKICSVSGTANSHDAYYFYVKWLASLMWAVTGGHEQFGAVEVYAQDVSWTAFKWLPGDTIGTKTTATSQALLMSFTSTPMPKLIGEGVDWTHLFPSATVPAKDPTVAFKKFQQNLTAMADRCDSYNALADGRQFPDCFPMYTQNPRVLEVSLSV